MTTEQETMQILGASGAILTGIHVCFTPKERDGDPWDHSANYVDKRKITRFPRRARPLYRLMAAPCLRLNMGVDVDVVIGPAMGAIKIADHVALCISDVEGRDVMAGYTEPEDPSDKGSRHVLLHGFDSDVAGRRVVVVDDILTTGFSAARTVVAVQDAGGEVIGVVAIVNRGEVTAEQLGVPTLAVLVDMRDLAKDVWLASECPLCEKNVPLRIDIGQGEKWLKTDAGQAWLAQGGSIAQAA